MQRTCDYAVVRVTYKLDVAGVMAALGCSYVEGLDGDVSPCVVTGGASAESYCADRRSIAFWVAQSGVHLRAPWSRCGVGYLHLELIRTAGRVTLLQGPII